MGLLFKGIMLCESIAFRLIEVPVGKGIQSLLQMISFCMNVESRTEKEFCVSLLISIYCSYMVEHNSARKHVRAGVSVCWVCG